MHLLGSGDVMDTCSSLCEFVLGFRLVWNVALLSLKRTCDFLSLVSESGILVSEGHRESCSYGTWNAHCIFFVPQWFYRCNI